MSEYDESSPSPPDMQTLMKDKAHELFSACDSEQKGFITKRDMQRLQGELPLSPEQLEHVFDSLDDDGNGYLTLEEFTDGFGSFLGVSIAGDQEGMEDQVDTYIDEEEIDPREEQQNYKQMMNNIGAAEIFDEEPAVKSLWCRLRREDPDLAGNFEDFLYRITNDLRKSRTDFESLETALRSKTTSHDEEVRKLYEEMESQIKAEKEKVLAEERSREKQLRDQMEMEILEKDRQLQEVLSRQAELDEKLGYLNTVEAETKIENEKLMRAKEELEESFLRSQMSLEESQAYVNQLRQQQKDEKRARAKAALQLSEGIALERETLVKQLDMLKHMNRKLQDDKDEAEIRRIGEASPKKGNQRKGDLARQGSVLGKYIDPPGVSKHVTQQSSIPEDVEPTAEEEKGTGHIHKAEQGAGLMDIEDDIEDDIECDDDIYVNGHSASFIHPDVASFNSNLRHCSPNIRYRSDSEEDASDKDDIDGQQIVTKRPRVVTIHIELSHKDDSDQWPQYRGTLMETLSRKCSKNIIRASNRLDPDEAPSYSAPHLDPSCLQSDKISSEPGVETQMNGTTADASGIKGDNPNALNTTNQMEQMAVTARAITRFATPDDMHESDVTDMTPSSPRAQPVGADDASDSKSPAHSEPLTLQRVFKVVIVGDSGVGKSSFLYRYCNNHFKQSYAATIGVDFQIKSLNLEGHNIVLQLWDTAGQERFRSITKQYFRKADGVIVMYDVTSETTFTNVRHWMTSVEEGVSDAVILVLLGNKNDLPEDDDAKAVKSKHGSRLADGYEALFYETSALTGENVSNAMEALARLLKEKEDREIEKSLHLEEFVKKKKCCR